MLPSICNIFFNQNEGLILVTQYFVGKKGIWHSIVLLWKWSWISKKKKKKPKVGDWGEGAITQSHCLFV